MTLPAGFCTIWRHTEHDIHPWAWCAILVAMLRQLLGGCRSCQPIASRTNFATVINFNFRFIRAQYANYQMQDFGGGGWLRILRFRPRARTIDVFTWSPWYRRLRTEPDQQFTIPVPWMY